MLVDAMLLFSPRKIIEISPTQLKLSKSQYWPYGAKKQLNTTENKKAWRSGGWTHRRMDGQTHICTSYSSPKSLFGMQQHYLIVSINIVHYTYGQLCLSRSTVIPAQSNTWRRPVMNCIWPCCPQTHPGIIVKRNNKKSNIYFSDIFFFRLQLSHPCMLVSNKKNTY